MVVENLLSFQLTTRMLTQLNVVVLLRVKLRYYRTDHHADVISLLSTPKILGLLHSSTEKTLTDLLAP